MTKLEDPLFELGLLAANLQEEVKGWETQISVDHLDGKLVIAYHGIVVLHWRIIDDEFVCYPTSRRRTCTATTARRLREITVRLVFEFIRDLQHNT